MLSHANLFSLKAYCENGIYQIAKGMCEARDVRIHVGGQVTCRSASHVDDDRDFLI